MSKLSIFDDAWTSIVFEGKNKEYGAYQLRHDNPKTTVKALMVTLSLTAVIVSIPFLLSSFGNAPVVSPPIIPTEPTVHPVAFKAEPRTTTQQNTVAKSAKPQLSWDKPVITSDPDPKTEVPTNTAFNSNPGPVNGTPTESGPSGPTTISSGPQTVAEAPKEPALLMAVDVKPQFPGGMDGFYRYISRNFKSPEAEGLEGTKLTVLVYFVIEVDGSLSDIHVTRNPGYGMEKEAIRVLQSLKIKWQPGQIAGKPVRTAFSMPITVKTE